MKEELNRIKELMGLLTEDVGNNNCYPSDYEPGKMYERDDLAKMFFCEFSTFVNQLVKLFNYFIFHMFICVLLHKIDKNTLYVKCELVF